MRPRVSIVVPAYNSERYLAATLESVLAQHFADWELIVVDDGSTDGTADVADDFARRDPRIRVLRERNGGVAAARNRGYAATDPASEFVTFLDNDDLWVPATLGTFVGMLDEHPEYVSVHSVAQCIDSDGNQPDHDDLEDRMRERQGIRRRRVVDLDPSEPTTFADLAYRNWIVTPGLQLVRRSVLDTIGGFDPETVPCDDYDFSVRLARRGPIGYTDRSLLLWRRHGSAQSYQSKGWTDAHFRVREKMITDPANTAEQSRVARLGYVHLRRDTLRSAIASARAGEPKPAVRHVLRAAKQYGLYWRTRVRQWSTRAASSRT